MPHFPSSDSAVASEALSMLSIKEQKERMSSANQGPPGRIRIKNRRKRYLDLHPEYFLSAELELAGL